MNLLDVLLIILLAGVFILAIYLYVKKGRGCHERGSACAECGMNCPAGKNAGVKKKESQ